MFLRERSVGSKLTCQRAFGLFLFPSSYRYCPKRAPRTANVPRNVQFPQINGSFLNVAAANFFSVQHNAHQEDLFMVFPAVESRFLALSKESPFRGSPSTCPAFILAGKTRAQRASYLRFFQRSCAIRTTSTVTTVPIIKAGVFIYRIPS